MPTYNQDLSATSGNAPTKQVGLVDPLTGAATQQMTNVPPQQANTLGNAQPVFNQGVQQNAQGIYGGVDQRQNSVGAPLLFTDKDKDDDGFSSTADLTAQKKYNDQLRSQKYTGETFTRTVGKIEKVPQFTFTKKKGKIKKN